jgi:8-oxo-dGTP diphosphatase
MRSYPDRPIVGTGAVIYLTAADAALIGAEPPPSGAGVVLVKRAHEPLAGEWSLPGGALEIGETLEAGVAREAVEETGVVVNVGPVIEVFDRIMLDEARRVQYHFVLVDYLCRARGGRLLRGSDAAAVVVADAGSLDRFGLTDKARAVIARGIELADCRILPPSGGRT